MEEDGNKGPRRMGAAKSDVAQRAASRAQSSEAEVGLSAVSRVDFGCVGTLEDRNFVSSARVPQKKEEEQSCGKNLRRTQDYVSRQEMEVGDNKSLEELGFVPQVRWANLFGSSTCAIKSATKKELAHNEIFARDCYDCRLIESAESEVSNCSVL